MDEDILKEEANEGAFFKKGEYLTICSEITKWQRIIRVIRKMEYSEELKECVTSGDEDGVKELYRECRSLKEDLVKRAKELNIAYYGRLSKKELENEIRNYQENKIKRQRFERKH